MKPRFIHEFPRIIEMTRGLKMDPQRKTEDYDPTIYEHSANAEKDAPPDRKLCTCDAHGDYWAEPADCDEDFEWWAICKKCESDFEYLEEKYEARAIKARIPERYRGRSFEQFIADTPSKRVALKATTEMAETDPMNYCKVPWVHVLSGGVGTGKTHLQCAILDEWLWVGYQALYLTERDFYREIRASWEKRAPETEAQVLSRLIDIDLLVIDDLGTGRNTDDEKGYLYDLLNGRYVEMTRTIIGTNLDKKELTAYLGQRVFDRIKDGGKWVAFDWESQRGKKQKVVNLKG